MPAADQRLAAFYRLKTLLLMIDGMAVTQLTIGLALATPTELIIVTLVSSVALFSALVSWVGYLLLTGLGIVRTIKFGIFQAANNEYPGLYYLVLTQAALVAGILVGLPVASKNGPLLSIGLFLIGCFYLFLDFGDPRLGWAPWPSLQTRLLWAILFFEMALIAVLIALQPWLAEVVLSFLETLGRVSPGLALILGISRVGIFLYPHGWKTLSEGIVSRKNPLLMTIMLLSVFLPFGGLMIPFWFFLKDDLRVEKTREDA